MMDDLRPPSFLSAIELVKTMEEDCRAMVLLLHRKGLLMELPDATLDRCIGTLDRVNVFADQIRKRNTSEHHAQALQTSIKDVRRLGSLPDGTAMAMEFLAEAAESYLYTTSEEDGMPEGAQLEIEEDLAPVTELMDDLIRAHYLACRKKKEVWDPSELRQQMETLLRDYFQDRSPVSWYDETDRSALFRTSLHLLHAVVSRQAAEILVDKVAGHRLPIEVVEMIRDFVCSDADLRNDRSSRSPSVH